MIIYVLSGGCGVGKRTIGELLSERLGLFLFHNHLTANIAQGVYPNYGKDNFENYSRFLMSLREIVIMEALKNNCEGLVITHANHELRGPDYALWLYTFCKDKDIDIRFFNLLCDEGERLRRFTNEERKTLSKSCDAETFKKINSEWGNPSLLDSKALTGLLNIDVTNLSSRQVVDEILKTACC